MQISLSSGNYNIIDSRQIFLFNEKDDLKINVVADNKFQFSMIFKFWSDSSDKQDITKEIIDNNIIFSCINFHDMGTGLSSPVSIAKIDGKEYFLMFWSYLEGEENKGPVRSVKYTIYSEK